MSGQGIRTNPSPGKTAHQRRIAEAVKDEEWQKFRVLLKGKPTAEKLEELKRYYNTPFLNERHTCVVELHPGGTLVYDKDKCVICIRIDNYLKALCRGGQLKPRTDLATMGLTNWDYKQFIRS